MTREELIKHWAEDIIPAVFRAETSLQEKCPEWRERLKNIPEGKHKQVADEYVRAIAEIIIGATSDEEIAGMDVE